MLGTTLPTPGGARPRRSGPGAAAGLRGPRRGEVASAFFVVAYVALSVPVIGVGLLAQATDLKTAGLVFAACVAAAAGGVLVAPARPETA